MTPGMRNVFRALFGTALLYAALLLLLDVVGH